MLQQMARTLAAHRSGLLAWRAGRPEIVTPFESCLPHQGLCLAEQYVRFEPVVEVESELSFGIGRHSVTELIEPRLGLVQPAPRVLGFPDALMGKGQPDPVDHCTTRL